MDLACERDCSFTAIRAAVQVYLDGAGKSAKCQRDRIDGGIVVTGKINWPPDLVSLYGSM
jgi:hypothetical protein